MKATIAQRSIKFNNYIVILFLLFHYVYIYKL